MMEAYATWKGWDPREFGRWTPSDAAVYRRELRHTDLLGPQVRRVLELGFGNGNFAGFARSQGWQYYGTEIDKCLLDLARSAGYEVAEGSDGLSLLGHEYDLIAAWDVFEHMDLAELRRVLASASSLLAPRGALVARFPSGDSPIAGHIFYGDITHRTLLGSKAVRQLALEAGLEVVDISGSRPPLSGVKRSAIPARLGIHIARWLGTVALSFVSSKKGGLVFDPNIVATLRPLRSASEEGEGEPSSSQESVV